MDSDLNPNRWGSRENGRPPIFTSRKCVIIYRELGDKLVSSIRIER